MRRCVTFFKDAHVFVARRSEAFDHGRALVGGRPEERFAFRTPSLRNVSITAPYMHDGVHVDFERVLDAHPRLGERRSQR